MTDAIEKLRKFVNREQSEPAPSFNDAECRQLLRAIDASVPPAPPVEREGDDYNAEPNYQDIDGNPCSLDQLCEREPAWAANRIRVMREQLRSRPAASVEQEGKVADIPAIAHVLAEWLAESDGTKFSGRATTVERRDVEKILEALRSRPAAHQQALPAGAVDKLPCFHCGMSLRDCANLEDPTCCRNCAHPARGTADTVGR